MGEATSSVNIQSIVCIEKKAYLSKISLRNIHKKKFTQAFESTVTMLPVYSNGVIECCPKRV